MTRIETEHFILHSIVSFSGAYKLSFFLFCEGLETNYGFNNVCSLLFLRKQVLRTLFVTYRINTICSIVGYTFKSIFIKKFSEDPSHKNIESNFLKNKLMKNYQGALMIRIR